MRSQYWLGVFVLCGFGSIVPQTSAQVIIRKAVPVQIGGPVAENKKSLTLEEIDKKALESAKLKPDDAASLIGYLKTRTVADVDLNKIESLIKQLGAQAFDDRTKAQADLERVGLPAITALKKVADDSNGDPEVVYRAKHCLKMIEKVPQAELASAVVRALARIPSPEVIDALLAYIPQADNLAVSEAIRDALIVNAVKDGTPMPAIVKALTDPHPTRRIYASLALIEGVPAGEKLKDVYPKILESLKTEKDKEAKFQIAKSILLFSRDQAGMEVLLETIPDLNRGQIWQLEDIIAQIAPKDPPKERFLKSRESLVKAQTAWKDWWSKNKANIDLAKLGIKQRILGHYVTITQSYQFGQQGTIKEFGSDDKERWQFSGLLYPTDVEFTANKRVWVADQNASQITERDLTGKVLTTRRFEVDNGGWMGPAQPTSIKLLDNGNLFAVARNGFCEFDKDGKEVVKFARTPQAQGGGNQDVVSACKLQNGEYVVAVMNNGQNPQLIFVDKKGKEIKEKDKDGKEITKFMKTLPMYNFGGTLTEVGKNRVLMTESTRLVEYDLTDGKVLWEKKTSNPRCAQRLSNGNTLYIDGNTNNRAVEITPEGEEVWSYLQREPNTTLYRVVIR